MRLSDPTVIRLIQRQHGLITRSQAAALGLTTNQISWAATSERWRPVYSGVFAASTSASTPHQRLLAACLTTSGRASHQSAAWLWRLLDGPPPLPTVSTSRGYQRPRVGAVVHRVSRLESRPGATVDGIPCTDPRWTLIDVAGVMSAPQLDEVVDRALARRLVTVGQLETEVRRHAAPGRTGPGQLWRALQRRGLVGAPTPSVLESRTLRLLGQGGVRPLATEVRSGGGRYRLDVVLAPRLAMEVDGYAYHSSPEAMARDYRRRNELQGQGWTILLFTWADVTYRGEQVLETIRSALATTGE